MGWLIHRTPGDETAASAVPLPVEVELADGQAIRGTLDSWDDPPVDAQLGLNFLNQQLLVPVAGIRSVTRTDAGDTGGSGHEPPEGHQPLMVFHLVFNDGKTMEGETWGYANRRASGLYLLVRQSGRPSKPIWFPREALRSVRIRPAMAEPGALASDMPELFAMLERARTTPVISLAQALFELHLIDDVTLREWLAGEPARLRASIDARLAGAQLTQAQIERGRSRMAVLPEVNADVFEIDPLVLGRIPWSVAAAHHIVPLGVISETLYVASAAPMDRELQARLSLIAGGNLALVWADTAQIESRLAREKQRAPKLVANPSRAYLSEPGQTDITSQDINELMASAQNEISVHGGQVHSKVVDERSSVVLLVKRMILDAYRDKASDIHIETNTLAQHSRVRFRKDGDLEEYLQLPSDLRAALISRIKVMSKLDISERRRPQDGKINFADFADIKLELRVAILPTHDNLEDVVMRLLATTKPIALSKLGFAARDEAIVKRLSERSYGLILACGPTGSGKTTTLHSLLSEINTESRKIWTAEDPIEITQPGLRQLQVNPKIGVTFASAMRAFLRADPDVIMIGEVRDEETARIAIEASLTGHLVLSTLHTNSAAESIVRLLDLGMDPMNFADSLVGIIAQRLVRALCSRCKAPRPLAAEELERLAHDYVDGTVLSEAVGRQRLLAAGPAQGEGGVRLYQAVGCQACGGKGYKGRMGIYEVVENSPELKRMIETRASTNLVFDQAIASGTRSLKQDALEKVFLGVIDLRQAHTLFTPPSSVNPD
jgi:type II secretory ATPase GspE/PulE/Tfp pilus assembly ATPase PilB-like protein